MYNYPLFKQYDLKWANNRFSPANLTMKDKGCAITSLAMLAVWYLKDTNPGKLAKELKFTKDGLVYWNSLTKIFKDIKYIRRYNWIGTPANLNTIDKLLKTSPLLVETRFGWRRQIQHFVVVWEKRDGNYIMSDPLSEDKHFKQRYGDPARWIYGIRLFKSTRQDPLVKMKNDLKILVNLTFKQLEAVDITLSKVEKILIK